MPGGPFQAEPVQDSHPCTNITNVQGYSPGILV
jgi:hypothetical protein